MVIIKFYIITNINLFFNIFIRYKRKDVNVFYSIICNKRFMNNLIYTISKENHNAESLKEILNTHPEIV